MRGVAIFSFFLQQQPSTMAPITSSLASLRSVPLASSSRLISTSIPRLAVSTANRPKRDAAEYGIPTSRPRSEWPDRASTDTTNHPLWKFFGAKKESLEVPDKREDTSSEHNFTFPECIRTRLCAVIWEWIRQADMIVN